jgi:hypothetical protein
MEENWIKKMMVWLTSTPRRIIMDRNNSSGRRDQTVITKPSHQPTTVLRRGVGNDDPLVLHLP